MTEREALLAAVCENPDDDTPRLVFADWLDENGEPERAEFIRVQCWLASAGSSGPWNAYKVRLFRAHEIFEEFGNRWHAELPKCDSPELDWGWHFERGFAGEMLTVGAVQKVGPNYAWIEYEGTNCASLDWERIFWSVPITRLYLRHLTNWATVFRQSEAARLKSVALYECRVDIDTIGPLLLWAEQGAGHLHVIQERLAVRCGSKLHAAFGERFQWTRPLDDY